jgi:hypothetical protein
MRALRWLGLALLCACSDPQPVPEASPPPPPPLPSPTAALEGHGCEGDGAEGIQLWLDTDGDGHGDPRAAFVACAKPPGASQRAGDCDDQLASVHPGAEERCNGRDDDCDGQIDEADAVDAVPFVADADGDGHPDLSRRLLACRASAGWIPEVGLPDCDDREPEVHPGAEEHCNGRDDDCDEEIDEDAADALTWYRDADGDGVGDPTHRHVSCSCPEGFVEPGAWADCDDEQPAIHPGAAELCNELDDDCDGVVDEDDAVDAAPWYRDRDGDRFGDPAASFISCRPAPGYVSSPGDCDDLRASTHLGADELCNGLDDDCDGIEDEGDALDAMTWFADTDGDGFGDPARPRRACSPPAGHSATGGDCDDTRPSSHPEATEVCNGLDDDCDGVIDEPDADDAFTWYVDDDHDGWGDGTQAIDACYQPTDHVSVRGDCDDTDPAIHPEAGEAADGIDNDCDGEIDESPPGG